MGFLLPILLAVGVQAVAEADVFEAPCRPWVALLLVPVPYLIAVRLRRARIKGRFRRAEWLARLSTLSAVLCFALLSLLCGWVDCVRAWTGAKLSVMAWPEPALVLSFAPFVVYQLAAIDAEVRGIEPRDEVRRRMRTFHVRMFASALAPIVVYFGVAVLVGWNDGMRLNVQHVGLFNAGFVTALALLLASLLPALLTNTWETEPLPPGLQRELCTAVARKAEFEAREVRVWRTGNLLANAAIVGLSARRRVVLFSDSLLAILSLRELAAVFAHEIGHAKRHHVFVFVAWALAFFLGGDLLAGWLFPGDDWAGLSVLAIAMVLWYFGFGWQSRRCELEADLYSFELLRDPEAMMSALQRVGGRLRDVASWRHFSTNDRVGFMHKVATDPDFAPRFRRRRRAWAWCGVALALITIGLQVAELAADLPEDRVVVDLARGQYAQARDRLERSDAPDSELLELARAAAGLAAERGTALGVAELEEEFRVSIERRELERALLVGELLLYRDRFDLLEAVEAVEAWVTGARDGARASLEFVAEPWRTRLATSFR
ncbi:MAG: M48 family metalloprotease [bacterium]|nr:M48 family metalloprotease [bacterium]